MSEPMTCLTDRRSFFKALAAAWPLARLRAQNVVGGKSRRKVAMVCPTASLDEFRRLADFCAGNGITHLEIADMPKARWQWVDPNDPYPNWGMLHASLFKIAVPEALRPFIPGDTPRRSLELLSRRGEILHKLGLKATWFGADPMWLPEAVYAAHPEWRGPRCQWPPRSSGNYYAPCIDRPEVLEMYRKSTAEVCRAAPFEQFTFLTNDSGAGICWHPGLYPGVNGPEFCQNRTMADRMNGFARALQAGAQDAGLDADILIAGFSRMAGNEQRRRVGAGTEYRYGSNTFPVLGIPQPCAFAEQLETVFAAPEADWRLTVGDMSMNPLFDLIREFRRKPAKGVLQRVQALSAVAASEAGEEGGPNLLRAWECIGRAVDSLRPYEKGGPILLLGSINQRWLVRPLVPFPLELKPAEKDYYRKFQFQAWSEQRAANLMDTQGNVMIFGPASTWLAAKMFDEAVRNLLLARDALRPFLTAHPADSAHQGLPALDARLHALILVIRNAKYTAQYQEFLERFDQAPSSRPDQQWGRPIPADGMKIVEDDMANTKELIALLESAPVRLLACAPTAQEEDVFLFNPDLVSQLRRKIEISNSHLPEHKRF